MSNGYDSLVSGLEARFDYQSARTVAKEAVAAAGLKEQAKYATAELEAIVHALSGIGTDLGAVWKVLGVSPTGAVAPVDTPAKGQAEEAKEAEESNAAKEEAADDSKKSSGGAKKKPAAKKKAASKKK